VRSASLRISLLCRSDRPLPLDLRRKVALFCNVQENAVISALDVPTIYEVPLAFHEQGLDDLVVADLKLDERFPNADLKRWRELVSTIKEPSGGAVKIAIVGKYVELEDSYKSLREALTHAGVANDLRVNVSWIESENLVKENYENDLHDYDAILVPGGFGKRGIAGMLQGNSICEAVRDAVFRHLPRYADGLHRVCTRGLRAP
jgi:CTP synthase